jgi:hypothetical protein
LILPAQLGPSPISAGVGVEVSTNPLGNGQLLGNPGFENGDWSPWVTFGTPILDGSSRHSGNTSAHMGNTNNANDQVIQMVTVPANASQVTVDFWYRLATGETSAGADFFCYGLWSQDGATSLVQRCMAPGAVGSQAWSQEIYTLTANERASVTGRTVLLAFVVQTNAAYPSQVWIDDTALNVSASAEYKLHLPLVSRPLPTLPPGETGAFWLPNIGGNSIRTTYGTSVAVDSAGGIHVGMPSTAVWTMGNDQPIMPTARPTAPVRGIGLSLA